MNSIILFDNPSSDDAEIPISHSLIYLDTFKQCGFIEIKFDNFLPSFIKSIIQVPSSPNLAISKYVISRKRFKFYSWEDQ